jgi:hypothetical protein
MISSRAILSLEPLLGRDNLGRSPAALRRVWFGADKKRLGPSVTLIRHPGYCGEGIKSTVTLYNPGGNIPCGRKELLYVPHPEH